MGRKLDWVHERLNLRECKLLCEQCGEDHAVEDMEIAFRRPDDVAQLTEEERKQRVQENRDLCVLDGERFFIRGVLPLPLPAAQSVYNIGLWVEVERLAFERVYELWLADDQAEEPAFSCTLANHIPSLPATLGLAASLCLTGPKTRPNIFLCVCGHPLHAEQVEGISAHRAHEYNSSFE
jgi:hypothetical protein